MSYITPYRAKVAAILRFKTRIEADAGQVLADLELAEKTFMLGQFARAESYVASAEIAANLARHHCADLRMALIKRQTS